MEKGNICAENVDWVEENIQKIKEQMYSSWQRIGVKSFYNR